MTWNRDDLAAFLEALAQEPSARAELRRLARDEQSDRIEASVERLATALTELVERVDQLAQAQTRTEQRIEELAQAQTRTEQRIEELAQAQTRTEQRIEEVARNLGLLVYAVQSLSDRFAIAEGDRIERRYREKGPALFSKIALRLEVLSYPQLDNVLDKALADGLLDQGDVDKIRDADIILRGRRRDDLAQVYLVVEASLTVDERDVIRAVERAALMSKAGTLAIAVVAGERITDEASAYAKREGVWHFTNGRTEPPAPLSRAAPDD